MKQGAIVDLGTRKLHIRYQGHFTYCRLYIPEGIADLEQPVDESKVCQTCRYSRQKELDTQEEEQNHPS